MEFALCELKRGNLFRGVRPGVTPTLCNAKCTIKTGNAHATGGECNGLESDEDSNETFLDISIEVSRNRIYFGAPQVHTRAGVNIGS